MKTVMKTLQQHNMTRQLQPMVKHAYLRISRDGVFHRNISLNKKVLLCDRKKRTPAAYLVCVVCCWGEAGEGTPVLVLVGGGIDGGRGRGYRCPGPGQGRGRVMAPDLGNPPLPFPLERTWDQRLEKDLGPETGVLPPLPPCKLTNKLKILPSPVLQMQGFTVP